MGIGLGLIAGGAAEGFRKERELQQKQALADQQAAEAKIKQQQWEDDQTERAIARATPAIGTRIGMGGVDALPPVPSAAPPVQDVGLLSRLANVLHPSAARTTAQATGVSPPLPPLAVPGAPGVPAGTAGFDPGAGVAAAPAAPPAPSVAPVAGGPPAAAPAAPAALLPGLPSSATPEEAATVAKGAAAAQALAAAGGPTRAVDDIDRARFLAKAYHDKGMPQQADKAYKNYMGLVLDRHMSAVDWAKPTDLSNIASEALNKTVLVTPNKENPQNLDVTVDGQPVYSNIDRQELKGRLAGQFGASMETVNGLVSASQKERMDRMEAETRAMQAHTQHDVAQAEIKEVGERTTTSEHARTIADENRDTDKFVAQSPNAVLYPGEFDYKSNLGAMVNGRYINTNQTTDAEYNIMRQQSNVYKDAGQKARDEWQKALQPNGWAGNKVIQIMRTGAKRPDGQDEVKFATIGPDGKPAGFFTDLSGAEAAARGLYKTNDPKAAAAQIKQPAAAGAGGGGGPPPPPAGNPPADAAAAPARPTGLLNIDPAARNAALQANAARDKVAPILAGKAFISDPINIKQYTADAPIVAAYQKTHTGGRSLPTVPPQDILERMTRMKRYDDARAAAAGGR